MPSLSKKILLRLAKRVEVGRADYPITDAVAVDGVVNQIQAGRIVDDEGPPVLVGYRQLECDGVVVPGGSVQGGSSGISVCLVVDYLGRR